MEISWKRKMINEGGIELTSEKKDEVNVPLLNLPKDQVTAMGLKSNPKALVEGKFDASITEKVYFLNMHSTAYMSRDMLVAPGLRLDSE